MKTLVVYYSYAGHTKKLAEIKAGELGADLMELKEVKRSSMLGTFFRGCPKAIGGKPAKLQPFDKNLDDYEKIVLAGPIWASNPAPPLNNVIEALPQGREVELLFVSGSGNSDKSGEKYRERIEQRGSRVTGVHDFSSADVDGMQG